MEEAQPFSGRYGFGAVRSCKNDTVGTKRMRLNRFAVIPLSHHERRGDGDNMMRRSGGIDAGAVGHDGIFP